ncbi:glycosyltransferase [Xanthomonas sp. NCPPB 2654]|uniref:glycosyltransferase n=1 Tax=unclassified Xanthomonas TaxID=2643310 RepID=UPI0021E0246C|nr:MULTISPECIES: glycosyltransferase [unclassified Xanthomonas]MDL5366689.1 glycosyltransferase [Xanthomonas sp. NCPPB 2654]UYC22669.1 glycosyltransferase [Xanthomonas sp. CFBP 8443]
MSHAPSSSPEAPLVSVVMPAYKARFLPQALHSVRAQTHRPLELVVCDDSRDSQIQAMVEAFAAEVDFPVLYRRNPTRLWEVRSTTRGVALASGDYIKFLHDDDVLHPDCIAALLAALRAAPSAALAAARRRLVDADGAPLPDELSTSFPFAHDVLIDGRELTAFLAEHTVNFIGEPSAVLCRRAPLLALGDGLATLNGVRITWVADLALYVKLLRDGPLAMLARPLLDFRISREQFSQLGRDRPGIGTPGHEALRRAIHDLGWSRDDGTAGEVAVAPLDGSAGFARVDLLQALRAALTRDLAQRQLRDWQARRTLLPAQQALLDAHLRQAGPGPRLGVLVSAPRDGDAAALQRTLASLALPGALYANLSVWLLGAAVPPSVAIGSGELGSVAFDPAYPADALNAAIGAWDVDWLVRVDAGTEFAASGLLRLLLELQQAQPPLRALYADEWQRGGDGGLGAVFRPDVNLDLLLSNPAAMARHWVFRRDAVLAAGGFSTDHPGALELALILQLIQRGGLAGLGHLPEPLLTCDATLRDDPQAQMRAIQQHLQQRGYHDALVAAIQPGLYRIDYAHGQRPSVSIVLVVHDDLARLQRCVVGLLEKTAHPHYEVLLVDNASAGADTRQWLHAVAGLAGGRIRVICTEQPLGHAPACNLGAAQAEGDYLLFLRADTAVVQAQWLDALLNHGQRPEVGVVGARTVSGDGAITHAGLLPGLLEGGGHAFVGEAMTAPGYMGRLQVDQNYSAVSDACLLLRRALFAELGGFDAETFPQQGADIDLCLRAGALGYLTVWTPHALLLRGEAAERAPDAVHERLFERWLPQLAHDPAYNPNLRLDRAGGFRLDESEFSWRPLPGRPLPVVLAHPDDAFGSGHYRVIQPFLALRDAGLIDGAYHARLLDTVELQRFAPDAVVLRRVGDDALRLMQRMHRHSRAFKVFELDDFLPKLPPKSVHREHMPKDIARSVRKALSYMDRFVVSTAALAEAYAGYHADIRVVENRLSPQWWGALPASRRNAGAKPRVGWAGGSSHTGDLELLADVVRDLADEVTWVFFGLCPDKLRPYVHEVHAGVELARYPRALAALDLDLALAPLEQNLFNECKSNLRLLEYGACGYPVVASDLRCYAGALPVTRVKNRYRDWIQAIRMHLADAPGRAAAGDALREAVRHDWMLQGAHLQAWRSAWLPD